MSRLFVLSLSIALCLPSIAQKDIHHNYDPYEIRFISKENVSSDANYQAALRQGQAWSGFTAAHPGWHSEFDEDNQRPARAFGPGIQVEGENATSRALSFIANELTDFNIQLEQLSLITVTDNGKHHQVFFEQQYQDIPVMYSNTMVKMTYDGRVISWSAIVHDDIDLSIDPIYGPPAAVEFAAADMAGVTNTNVLDNLKILSVPGYRAYTHHLVYEVEVSVERENGIPSLYETQVDANTGEVLQRIDRYHTLCTANAASHSDCNHPAAAAEVVPPVTINATFSANTIIYDPSEASEVVSYPHMEVVIDGTTLSTDENGLLASALTGPVDATVLLQGDFADVRDNNTSVTPSTTLTLSEGDNSVSLDGLFSDEELSAYTNTNVIHDYMRDVLPTFEDMDFAMPINIDIAPHDCNAFYNGSSINFFVGGDDCVSLILVSDVIFHEYGHGINDNFYTSQGANFINGGMNEGYADVWAYFVYEDPILGDGHNPQLPDDFIRRYDQDPKVYPQDLVGEVHADGEIIAGAWWDTFALLGNDMATTTDLFRMAYTGLQATASNGNEGIAFLNVLIDVLEADDDDGNILNGTPNGAAISEGFAIHGITFLATAEIDHDEIESIAGNEDVLIEAEIDFSTQFTDYLEGVALNYRLSNSDVWTEVDMTDLGNNAYEAVIPEQPAGTIIGYYLGVKDIFGNLSAVTPIGAAVDDPTLPHYILVGYDLLQTYDSDDEEGDWAFQQGLPSDNATTGEWEEVDPIGSFQNGNEVAPNTQATPDGEFCFVTGNSFNVADGIGVNDIDAGTTTLISTEIDLSDFNEPAFSYMRWYTNNTGANPVLDWWQVQVSDDGGQNWVPVEDTKVTDASWRRNAFRISDYVDITDEFMIKFNASDSLRPGENLDGGSLIEAALDDFKLYESLGPNGLDDILTEGSIALYPIPTRDELTLRMELKKATTVRLRIINSLGQTMREQQFGTKQGPFVYNTSVGGLAEGMYTLEITTDDGQLYRPFQIN